MSAAVSGSIPGPAQDAGVAARLARRRRVSDRIVTGLCLAATAIGLLLLASILVTLLLRGVGGLSLNALIRNTAPHGSHGGLANAIVGSLLQTAVGTLIGTPIGLMVGTYLSEYAGTSALGNAVRFVSDVLLSAPSILIGLFIYQIFVLHVTGYSGIAGSVALSLIVIPIVVRTTEDMLRLIPIAMREAAVALGAPKWTRDRLDLLPGGAGRHPDRAAAGDRAHRGGDGAAAVHQPGQPERHGGLRPAADDHHRVRRGDEQPAAHHLRLRRLVLPGRGGACLGRRPADHLRRAGAQHRRARDPRPAQVGP